MTRFIALTGLPRSGSTLCCHLVGASPDAVALVEPMDVMALDASSPARAALQVVRFFEDSAASLLAEQRAPSVHASGALPDNPYGVERRDDGLRARTVSEVGPVRFDKPLSPDFVLMVKHNAAFAALLPELSQHVEVFALMRNPLAVLCSWQTVPIPPQRGRAVAAEHLDAGLRRTLDAEPDVLERQLRLLDWFFSRYLACVPEARRLRYEDIVSTQGASLRDAMRLRAPEESAPMDERNTNPAYRDVDVPTLVDRLSREPGAWHEVYAVGAIERLAERMRGGG